MTEPQNWERNEADRLFREANNLVSQISQLKIQIQRLKSQTSQVGASYDRGYIDQVGYVNRWQTAEDRLGQLLCDYYRNVDYGISVYSRIHGQEAYVQSWKTARQNLRR